MSADFTGSLNACIEALQNARREAQTTPDPGITECQLILWCSHVLPKMGDPGKPLTSGPRREQTHQMKDLKNKNPVCSPSPFWRTSVLSEREPVHFRAFLLVGG